MGKVLWELKNQIKFIRDNIEMIRSVVMENYQLKMDRSMLEIFKMIWSMVMVNCIFKKNAILRDIGWIIKKQNNNKFKNQIIVRRRN